MKKFLLFIIVSVWVNSFSIYGQAPSLTVKKDLPTSLKGTKTFTNATGVDTINIPFSYISDFTLEVKGKVTSAEGRGMDIEARRKDMSGFRTSVNTSKFQWTNPLNNPVLLNFSSDQEQTLRYAVQGDIVHVYQNGTFLESMPLGTVYDLKNDAEQIPENSINHMPNMIYGCLGQGQDGTTKPNDAGWGNTGNGNIPWNTVNASSGVRFVENYSGLTCDGKNYTGRAFLVRWGESSVDNGSSYYYPVNLEANKTYRFSFLATYWSNSATNADREVKFAVSKENTGNNLIESKTIGDASPQTLERNELIFTTTDAGTYYILMSAQNKTLWIMADLDIREYSGQSNLVDGILGQNSGSITPPEIGWGNSGSYVPWNPVNAGGGVRLIDALGGLTYKGQNFTDRSFLMRWESGVDNGSYYYYPVTLEANTTYKLSFLYGYWNNGSTGRFTIGVGTGYTSSEVIKEVGYDDWDRQTLDEGELSFTTTDAGTYYLLFSSETAGIWILADLYLHKFSVEPRIIIGKNYPSGAVDMEISSVTYDSSGAYAPEESASAPKVAITLNNEDLTMTAFINSEVTVSGKSNIYVTGDYPLRNSTINLTSDDSWLYLESIRPSKTTADLLQYIKINGQPFDQENDRMSIYGSGTVIIPNGKKTMKEALTVYTEPNFGGTSKSLEINTYYNELGELDNKIQSFKLKKGFSATLANNPDGTGFSRVFIASDADLEVPVMPEGMEGFVSFVRVFKWEWTSKKGWAGGVGSDALNEAAPSISYDWDAAANTENIDTEYVPMRHNLGWQSFDVINSRNNVSHVLGYNEPDRPDQSNIVVEDAIKQWPELFKSGLRLGSPTPASTPSGWLNKFMSICDSLNYRVDFVVTHAYQYQPTSWWEWMVNATSTNANNRPVWITEWNNGANWTNESWPTASGPQRDADLNIIYDDNGNEIIVNKPLSPENAERQVQKLGEILTHMEKLDLLEHHFFYNWVQDARAIELGGKLTPAGKMFANFKSKVGFKKSKEYVHTWKIAPPWINQSLSNDYKEITLSWYDHNGETGKSYILERKLDSESDYTVIATFTAGTDYEYAGTINYKERLAYNAAKYRVKAISYKDTESIYSREIDVKRDPSPATPVLSGEAISSSILKIKWDAVANARSYNIKRSTSANGDYETIASYYNDSTAYVDKELTRNTTFYYKISALNSSGEGVDSKPLELTTRDLDIPGTVDNLYVSSGDGNVTLTWDFAYDTEYKIMRSKDANGTFTVVADNFEGTRYVDKSGITNGETYYYKVQGKNILGNGPESAVLEATPQTGQHLHISFNENTGINAYDDWGGYHAELKDNAQWIPAEDGNGVSLSTSDQSYIQLGNNVVSDLNDFTIASWFKTPEGGNRRLFDFGSGTGTFMILVPQANATQARYKITCPTGTFDVYMDCEIPLNEWVHIAITQKDKEFKLYLNGDLQFTGENTDGINPSHMGATSQNYLGRSQWSSDPYTNHSYDDFRIYNYALAAKDIKKLFNREEINPNQTLNILGLSVNGQPWNIKDKYIMDCSNSTNQLSIEVTTDANVSVVVDGVIAPDNTIFISNIKSPSQFNVNFKLRDDNDETITTDYSLSVEKYFDFDDIVVQRWNNTLAVNNNSSTNGGYTFTSYKWYKNGQQVSTKQYYTAGRNKEDVLDTSAEYYVEVMTNEGYAFRTCASTVALKSYSVKVYPSPVQEGEMINVELSMEEEMINNATIELFDTNGNRIITQKAQGSHTTITPPYRKGIYIVNVKSGNFSEQQKIIIK